MENLYIIESDACSPDDVLFRDDNIIQLYYQLRESQTNSSWVGNSKVSEKVSGRLRCFIRKLFNKPSSPSNNVEMLILKADGCADLEYQDMITAVKLLHELSKCPVPRISEKMSSKEHRHVFFNDSEHWKHFLPQLQAIWSKDDRVVVFYAWGHAASFYNWSIAFQPDLANKLQKYGNQIIVVVPSIKRLDKHLLITLESERDRIWSHLQE